MPVPEGVITTTELWEQPQPAVPVQSVEPVEEELPEVEDDVQVAE